MPTYKYLNDTGLERTLSKLKTYIDSQSGGGSDGHGLIICDTSTMAVGDVVRVKSVYNPLVTEDKIVAIVGVPLYFVVDPYDYYKICVVYQVEEEEIEAGEQYTTIDVGQTVRVEMLVKTTLKGIKAICNLHLEADLMVVGDEVTVTVNGQPWVMQVAGINIYGSHSVVLISKYCDNSSYSPGANSYGSRTSVLNFLSSWYNAMATADKECVAIRDVKYVYNNSGSQAQISQYVWIPSVYEVYGSGGGTTQFPIFTTQANRIRRTTDKTARMWMTTTCNTASQQGYTNAVNPDGSQTAYTANACYMLPCFMVMADA